MTTQEYQDFCKKGILSPTKQAGEALIFGLGLTGEAGEVADIIKKHYGHGKELDMNHLKEELGDVLWYIANLCNTYGFTMDEVMRQNVEKLKKRYADKYCANPYRLKDPKKYKCKECGCTEFNITHSGPHIKLSCKKCDTFIKFLSRDEIEYDGEEDDLPWEKK